MSKHLSWWLLLLVVGCNRAPAPAMAPATPAKPVDPPNQPILYQPRLTWEDGYISHQGTGSFVRGPSGETVAITSAHFLDFAGPALKEVHWLDVRMQEPVARMTASWGDPGDGGQSDNLRIIDLRRDYFLMPAPDTVPQEVVLELDPRSRPDIGEPIWFPDKDPQMDRGYRLVAGRVVAAAAEFHSVELDETIKPVSQSGSPIVSQRSGKVIGIWGRATMFRNGLIHIHLVPSRTLLDVLKREDEFMPLADAVGKKGAKRKD